MNELSKLFSNSPARKSTRAHSFELAKTQKLWQVCPELSGIEPEIEQRPVQANKVFIELIHLGAIKAIITFKLEKRAVELDFDDPA